MTASFWHLSPAVGGDGQWGERNNCVLSKAVRPMYAQGGSRKSHSCGLALRPDGEIYRFHQCGYLDELLDRYR